MSSYVHVGIEKIRKTGKELEGVNNRMRDLLNRLPLSDNKDIIELAKLSESQRELLKIEMPQRKPSMKEMTFLNAQIDSAYMLQQRYSQELSSGRIRR